MDVQKLVDVASKYVVVYPKIYIHHGSDHFDRQSFGKIKNCLMPWNKPEGRSGLWASPIDSCNGWADWCIDNNFHTEKLTECFMFTLKENSKVVKIYNDKDLDARLSEGICKFTNRHPGIGFEDVYFDFEQLVKDGYDAIEVYVTSNKIYSSLYGWDCDSILILNPDCIVEL